MSNVTGILILIFISFFGFSAELSAAENVSRDYKKQLKQIRLFYDIINKKNPTVSDFFRLFGKDNEAELEIILRHNFPLLSLNDWDLNLDAANHIDKIYKHPASYPSRFLQCIKIKEPQLFANKLRYRIQVSPEIDDDIRKFIVSTQSVKDIKVVFEFSQSDPYIETILLPNGESIYTLIETCSAMKVNR